MFIFLIFAQVLSECSESYFFTECSKLGTRKAVISRQGQCSLPSIQVLDNLDCDLSCEAGYYLEVLNSEQVCSPCPIGKYSLGGSQIFGVGGLPWFKSIEKFVNQCWTSQSTDRINYNCDNWAVYQDNLVSGSSYINFTYISFLKFEIRLVKTGNFSITYRKEMASQKDLFEFSVKINKVKKFSDKVVKGKIWNTFTMKLEPGLYQVEIDLMKDPGKSDESKVFIHSIVVEGVRFADSSCLDCHSFMPVNEGNTCKVCDYNQYFNGEVCEDCPDDSYSHRGSVGIASCIPRYPCSMKDLVQLYSNCINSARSMYFEYKSPVFCSYQNYTIPPSIDNLPCEPCSAGYKSVNKASITSCEPCPDGERSQESDGESFCLKCPAGTISYKSLQISSWTSVPSPFLSYCKEANGKFCSLSDGWIAESSFLSSGHNLVKGMHLYLDLPLTVLSSQGSVSFSYQFFNRSSGSFELHVDGKLHKSLKSATVSNETLALPSGVHFVQLVYISFEGYEEVRIFSVGVQGSRLGGAEECISCESGFVSSEGSGECSPCPAGFTSDVQHSECVQCAEGFYSLSEGQSCVACPSGTVSNSNHTGCVVDSVLTLASSSYFIYALANMNSTSEVENVCSSLSSRLYCYQTFYGPVNSQSGDYYLSILNPSALTLPSFSHSAPGRPGYCFGFFTQKNGVSADERESCSQVTRVKNFGQEVKAVSETREGLLVEYENGDLCENGLRYNSSVNIICDKAEEYGWPSVSSYDECSVSFTWKTKYGCRVCQENELKNVTGLCKDGYREITQLEGSDCILIQKKEKIYEKCLSGVFKSEVFVVFTVVGACGLFSVLFGILALKMRNTRTPLVMLEKPQK